MRILVSAGRLGPAYRFVALRYPHKKEKNPQEREQYQLFDTPEYTYRVFITDMDRAIDLLVWFYNRRAGVENLIKEANNDAGLAAHPSGRWATNCVHFQLVMLAYNLNCWLLLFQREEGVQADQLQHTGWLRRVCVFCLWPPRSGSTPGELASAIATNMRSEGCFSG